MSAVAKSKPEILLLEVQKLRDLCYRDKENIHNKVDDMSENNILVSCNVCLINILTDLEIERSEDKEKKNILDQIQQNLLAFEANILGTRSMASQNSTIESLIDQCTHVRSRMEATSYCNII